MQVLRQTQAAPRTSGHLKFVFVCLGLAAVVAVAFLGLAFWSQNEFTQPEGIVATQSTHFSQQGSLYFSLRQYPYTVCAYMPVFYTLVAGLIKAGLPVLAASRLVSILATAAVFWLVFAITRVYTNQLIYAALSLSLAGVSQLLLSWGTTGQVDMLTVAFSVAAFYQFSRFQVRGEETLDLAAAFAVAALFTKQTAIAAPATIFLLLLRMDWRRAARFAAITAGLGGAMVLSLNALLSGRFLTNTVFANMNPFAFYKLKMALDYAGAVLSPIVLIVLLSTRAAIRQRLWGPFLYLLFASAVFFLTAPKVGADSNYLIESTVMLAICTGIGLKSLEFFELSAAHSKSWVTLLMIPLGLYIVQNVRVSVSALTARLGREIQFAKQIEDVRPYLASPGRVLSVDSNALLHAGRIMEVEPLIYRLLVEAGRIEPAPVQHDIDTTAFKTIVLYEDVSRKGDPDPEIPRLTPAQMQSIGRHYELVHHSPGPYLGGLYIYQPRASAPSLAAQRN